MAGWDFVKSKRLSPENKAGEKFEHPHVANTIVGSAVTPESKRSCLPPLRRSD